MAGRIVLGRPEGKSAPAAAQLQDLHAIGQSCPTAHQLKCAVFGFVQVADTVRPIAAAVFQMPAEDPLKKNRRQGIVLPVGIVGVHSHRSGAHLPDEELFARYLRFGSAFFFGGQSLKIKKTDPETDQGVGNLALVGQFDECFHNASPRCLEWLGIHGKKAGVVWTYAR